jgi:hypothetical protein
MPSKEVEVENKMKIVQANENLAICPTFPRSKSRSFNPRHVNGEQEIQRRPMPL